LTGRLFDRLMTVGLPLTLVAALAGAPVFAAVFGDEWREAGRYVQYLSVYMFFSFLANPLSTIVWVKEAQLGSLLFQFSLLASRVGGVLLGASMNSVRAAVVLLALAGAGVFLVYLTWILRLAGCPPRHLVSSVAGQLPRAALAVCPLLIVLFLPGLLGGDWGVTVGAAVSSVLAVALPVRRPQVSA
jgi:O-antigen/teichoic acid export membrane protein